MVVVQAARGFPVPLEGAFDYITDPRNWPRYWPDLIAVQGLDQARWGRPGDTVGVEMRLGGRRTLLEMTLTELRRPRLVTYHSRQRGLPEAVHERHFDPVPGGFVYRLVVRYTPRAGLVGLVDRTLVRRGIRRALRLTLDQLDRQLVAAPSRDQA